MTDKEKVNLIRKIITVAWEYAPGDNVSGFWEATVQAIECVAEGVEDDG